MGFKRNREEPPKVEAPVKKEVVKKKEAPQPKKIEKKKVEPLEPVKRTSIPIETKEPKVEVPTELPIALENSRVKKPWDGLGIIGNCNELSIFKGKVKTANKKLGEEIFKMIVDFNAKN